MFYSRVTGCRETSVLFMSYHFEDHLSTLLLVLFYPLPNYLHGLVGATVVHQYALNQRMGARLIDYRVDTLGHILLYIVDGNDDGDFFHRHGLY